MEIATTIAPHVSNKGDAIRRPVIVSVFNIFTPLPPEAFAFGAEYLMLLQSNWVPSTIVSAMLLLLSYIVELSLNQFFFKIIIHTTPLKI